MVAPHETGDVVKSLIRIPGSGKDRTLPSECCDLSKVSALAAAVPVDTLPPVLAQPQAAGETSDTVEMSNRSSYKNKQERPKSLASEFGSRTNPRQQPAQSRRIQNAPRNNSLAKRTGRHGLPSPKKPRQIVANSREPNSSNLQMPSTSSTAQLPMNSTSQPQYGRYLQPQQSIQQGHLSFLQTGFMTTITLSQALEELGVLQSQNAELRKRISLFQQLFQDKKRLASVVNTLMQKQNE